MQNAIIIYAIVQLITNAYGLAVIESIRPMVEKELKDKGYIKNKNSLYTFSNTIVNVLKGFIPFYYLGKSISLLKSKNNIDNTVNAEIKSGKYININENNEYNEVDEVEDINYNDSLFKSPYDYVFEKPDKYKAVKNDISLYDTYETPVDYIERVSKKEDDIELTPFKDVDRVVEHVVVKEGVSKADIAKAVTQLSASELEILGNKINELTNIKRKNDLKLKLEKDVA